MKPRQPTHTPLLGGDFQASPDPTSQSFNTILAPILDTYAPLSDPLAKTFRPADTSLDHWLTTKEKPPRGHISHIIPSIGSDHNAVLVRIPDTETGAFTPPTQKPTPFNTTRKLPQFTLTLDTTHVDCFRIGTPCTEALVTRLTAEVQSTSAPDKAHIDKAAQTLMELLQSYAAHATAVWPSEDRPPQQAQPKHKFTGAKTRSTLRHLRKTVQLRNAATTALSNKDAPYETEILEATESILGAPQDSLQDVVKTS